MAPPRPGPVPPMAGTGAIGAICVPTGPRHQGRSVPVLDGGALTGTAYRLPPIRRPGPTPRDSCARHLLGEQLYGHVGQRQDPYLTTFRRVRCRTASPG